MTTTRPELPKTSRYSVTQVAKILQVTPKTVRTWIESGKIRYGVHRLNGRKFFTGQEITRAWSSEY